MGQVVEFKKLHRARRHRAEKQSTDQCIELLEWSLKHNVDRYLSAPYGERLFRATGGDIHQGKIVGQYLGRLNGDFAKFKDDFELLGKHLGHAQSSYQNADKRLDQFAQEQQSPFKLNSNLLAVYCFRSVVPTLPDSRFRPYPWILLPARGHGQK